MTQCSKPRDGLSGQVHAPLRPVQRRSPSDPSPGSSHAPAAAPRESWVKDFRANRSLEERRATLRQAPCGVGEQQSNRTQRDVVSRARSYPLEPLRRSRRACKSLLDCARVNANPLIYPFIFIGLETSMRLSEILNIRREHVDISGRAIFIPKAKAGARQQPMTARLAQYLESYLASLPEKVHWLFPSATSKTGHVVDIRKPFVRAISAAGLDPRVITPHVMRHTAITHAIQAGVDLPTVQKISGHKSLAMVVRYAHSSAPHVQEAMNKLEARFKEAA